MDDKAGEIRYPDKGQGDAAALGSFQSKNEPCENINDAFAEIDELAEQWKNRLSIDNLCFAKRYVKGNLWVAIEMAALIEDGPKKFVTVFQGNPEFRRVEGHTLTCRFKAARRSDGWQDGSVLIKDAELVEYPQGVPFPSLVRFYSSDDFFKSSTDSAEKFLNCRIRESVRTGSYWEIGVLQSAAGRMTSMENGAGCKRIQRSLNVLENVADASPPIVGDWLKELESKYLDGWFTILVGNEAIRVSFAEGHNTSVEIKKMLLGPVELCPTTI